MRVDSCRLHAGRAPPLATADGAPRTRTMGPMIALPLLATGARASRTAFPAVSAHVAFVGQLGFLTERYDLASCFCRSRFCLGCRGACRVQFDQWSRVTGIETRDLCLVGARGIGYIELPAAQATVGASDARPGFHRAARRIECLACDVDAVGVRIDREGAAVGERRWRRARAGDEVRRGAVRGLRSVSDPAVCGSAHRPEMKNPASLSTCGVLNFGGKGGIRTHGTGKPYA